MEAGDHIEAYYERWLGLNLAAGNAVASYGQVGRDLVANTTPEEIPRAVLHPAKVYEPVIKTKAEIGGNAMKGHRSRDAEPRAAKSAEEECRKA